MKLHSEEVIRAHMKEVVGFERGEPNSAFRMRKISAPMFWFVLIGTLALGCFGSSVPAGTTLFYYMVALFVLATIIDQIVKSKACDGRAEWVEIPSEDAGQLFQSRFPTFAAETYAHAIASFWALKKSTPGGGTETTCGAIFLQLARHAGGGTVGCTF